MKHPEVNTSKSFSILMNEKSTYFNNNIIKLNPPPLINQKTIGKNSFLCLFHFVLLLLLFFLIFIFLFCFPIGINEIHSRNLAIN